MGTVLSILVMLLGLAFIIRVIYSIKKGKLSEWSAMLWIVAGIILILLGAFPNIVTWVAGILGIYWAPSIVFLVAIVIIAVISINHSQEISIMQKEISEQAMHISLLEKEIEHLEKELERLDEEKLDEHIDMR